jgi:hypothetical protein
MTFLNSFFNKLDDIDQQFNNEIRYWSFSKLKNFNSRKCDCCHCYYDYDDVDIDYLNDIMTTHNKHCGNIGDNYHCYNQYMNSITQDIEEHEMECECNCIYPVVVDNPIRLTEEQVKMLIYFFKTKGISVEENDLNWDKEYNLIDCDWNNMLIDICHLTNEDINRFKNSLKLQRIRVFSSNYNVLRIMSGMSSLSYSS